VQVGKQNAEILKKRLPLCNDPKVDAYLTKLGLKLVAKLPTRGVQYPWEFHCVNSKRSMRLRYRADTCSSTEG